jgi:hypothetical protein
MCGKHIFRNEISFISKCGDQLGAVVAHVELFALQNKHTGGGIVYTQAALLAGMFLMAKKELS